MLPNGAGVSILQATNTPFGPPPAYDSSQPVVSPTPDSPHILPTQRSDDETYTIQQGDTLGQVATAYGLDLQVLLDANPEVDPNYLTIGQTIVIPAENSLELGSSFKIIPDSELIFSPYTYFFNLGDFVQSQGGYLSSYQEVVDGVMTSGVDIIDRVSREYSVNPRILLAVLEYESQWVTHSSPDPASTDYPMQYYDPELSGLYLQMSWAANTLNYGFYAWNVNAIGQWVLADSSMLRVDATINAGTAGVQNLMSSLHGYAGWNTAVSSDGVYATFTSLFGEPFTLTFDPLLPADLSQPVMQLPFEQGVSWSFTGGPHAGWGIGSAWAAIDFAPATENPDCSASPEWATAVAPGLIIRSENGVVILDLDGDGLEQTGWTVLYLHMASSGRVAVGTYVQAGDRIGHPSCEGGISNGTHMHMARRYNGEWIAADGSIPFNLDGWISQGTGVEYDGLLVNNGQVVEAWDRSLPENEISR
ncbi:MAG TPA: LysM peptidoglycan-binding domain-containing protein [Longilinea sp.]|nr:LysM peptidoglycan-binding domain-containing protein [Longilinea sp.]